MCHRLCATLIQALKPRLLPKTVRFLWKLYCSSVPLVSQETSDCVFLAIQEKGAGVPARVRRRPGTPPAHTLTFGASAGDKVSRARSYILLADRLTDWVCDQHLQLIRPPVFRCQLVLTFHPAGSIHICPLLSGPASPNCYPTPRPPAPPPTVCLSESAAPTVDI